MNDMPERLPSRPLRNWFLAWHIHTGDPAEVIAKGFDLDPVLVAEMLGGGAPPMIRTDEALLICRRLRLNSVMVWNRRLPVSWVSEEPELELQRIYRVMAPSSVPGRGNNWLRVAQPSDNSPGRHC